MTDDQQNKTDRKVSDIFDVGPADPVRDVPAGAHAAPETPAQAAPETPAQAQEPIPAEKPEPAPEKRSAPAPEKKSEPQSGEKPAAARPAAKKPAKPGLVDRLLIDRDGDEAANFTGDEESERDYRPIRQSRESRTGCLGGVMYFVFILCASVILACLAWMAASDVLALNEDEFKATVTLPVDIFTTETVDDVDEEGNVVGTKTVTSADIPYVSEQLKQQGLIEYKWLFELFCKISHADQKVSPGEYELSSSYDYRALVQHMRANSSSALTVDITFPEGYSMRQIFLLMEEKGVASYDDLMAAAADTVFNYDFIPEGSEGSAQRLEGYLFPDTYQFYISMQPSSAINKFLEAFNYNVTDEMKQQAANRGMSMQDIINIASMIEKEAANDGERRLIASVIYNRINTGMTLGIDSTILYLYPDHEGAPTAPMLAQDSPYNTRLYYGLPPTPICSPGLASIQAALIPEETNYYYYALDTATGTHRFFTDANEFNRFVETQNYG